MLRRKYTIQKSIRFDEKLAKDLEYLAEELERTQNDLVNIAVENLIKENQYYFTKLIIVDMLFEFFNCDADSDEITVDNITVKVWYNETDDLYYAKVINLTDENDLIEEFEEKTKDIDLLKSKLIDYSNLRINFNSSTVKEYLKQRLDYK